MMSPHHLFVGYGRRASFDAYRSLGPGFAFAVRELRRQPPGKDRRVAGLTSAAGRPALFTIGSVRVYCDGQ